MLLTKSVHSGRVSILGVETSTRDAAPPKNLRLFEYSKLLHVISILTISEDKQAGTTASTAAARQTNQSAFNSNSTAVTRRTDLHLLHLTAMALATHHTI